MSFPSSRRRGGSTAPVRPSRPAARWTRRLAIAVVAVVAGWGLSWSGDSGEDARTVDGPVVEKVVRLGETGARVEVVWSHAGASPRLDSTSPRRELGPRTATTPSQAYRDPATGRWSAPPAGEAPEVGVQRLSAATSTSAAGLVEEPLEGPRGGVRVSLRGRFRSALVAERDAAGRAEVGCGTATELSSAGDGEAAGSSSARADSATAGGER